MNRFKCLLLPIICLLWFSDATFSVAQSRQPNRDDRSRDDRNRNDRNSDYDPFADRYRNRSRCTEPLPMRSFNRDFASLSVTSPFSWFENFDPMRVNAAFHQSRCVVWRY
ncbi:MAG: hypothetical protein HC817_15055 [Saprospiraceae bacterium]|nr:hypothetical protein [Saprospiraceae bacterium]